MREATRDWLTSSSKDLRAAQYVMNELDLASVAVFHAQQGVEKLLKALLEEKEKQIPKTHDLERLYALVQAIWPLDLNEDTLALLSAFYIDSRYPSESGLLPGGSLNPAQTAELITYAQEVDLQIRKLLL